MDLTDFLIEKALVPELQAKDKEAVIKELVRSLTKSNAIKADDESSVVDALMKREELGSTGIGQGVAVPHARHPAIKELVGVFGHSTSGVDFNALDGEPVHAIFFVAVTRCLLRRASSGPCTDLSNAAERQLLPTAQRNYRKR